MRSPTRVEVLPTDRRVHGELCGGSAPANEDLWVREVCIEDATCQLRTSRYDGLEFWSVPAPTVHGFFGTVSSDGRALVELLFPPDARPELRFIDLQSGMTHKIAMDPDFDGIPRGSIIAAGRPCLVRVSGGAIQLTTLHDLQTVTVSFPTRVQAVALRA